MINKFQPSTFRFDKVRIMKIWREQVRQKVPAASNQSKLALDDSIPDYLTNLEKMLGSKTSTEERVAEVKDDLIGKVHGQHRANNSYTIDQMIEEYFILKEIVMNELRIQAKLTVEVCETVSQSFQKAVQGSAAQFSKSLLESQENLILGIAHDLRSPLTVIKLQSELMERRTLVTPESLAKIRSSVERLSRMIDQLLEKAQTKNFLDSIGDNKPFDIYLLATEVAETYQVNFDRKVNVAGSSTLVNWDQSSMERVFDNLISNAVKYGSSESPVTVCIRNDEENIFMSVHNDGPAIPLEHQVTLFEKFKRSEATSKDKPGWGLGLNYVKTVVERHKGTLLVNSDEKGTTFKFELPRDPKRAGLGSLEAINRHPEL